MLFGKCVDTLVLLLEFCDTLVVLLLEFCVAG